MVTYVCNILWQLWKACNEHLFSKKIPTPQAILRGAATLNFEEAISPKTTLRPVQQLVHKIQGEWLILVDASWDMNQRATTGMVIYNDKGYLEYVQYTKVEGQILFKQKHWHSGRPCNTRSVHMSISGTVYYQTVIGGSDR